MTRGLVFVAATLTASLALFWRYGDRIVDWLDRGNDLTPDTDDDPPIRQTGLLYINYFYTGHGGDPNTVIPPHPDTDTPLNLHEMYVWQACVNELEASYRKDKP